jgi:hypothetical protein
MPAFAQAAAALLVVAVLSGCSSLPAGSPAHAPALTPAESGVVQALRRPQPERLSRETLQSFFANDLDRLALLCRGNQPCPERERKAEQLSAFFQGSYLRPATNGVTPKGELPLHEAYAFHAIEYFSDPAYACKHPLVAQVLASAWQLDTRSNPSCNPLVPFLVTESGQTSQVRWVDPARVQAVHLVFAGEAGQSMSRFGHVSMRLIVCNKDRVAVDEQCESDLFDHISLGFKANIDEIDLSLWKGVMGGYQLKLYAQTFVDTYREYSIDEFRGVHSLPLVLTPAERLALLQGLSEVHWSYHNDYRFFTRNCATEVQWLLNSVLGAQRPGQAAFFPQARQRPDRLFADARTSDQFDGEVLRDLAEAERTGHHFPSAEKYYQLAAQTVAAQLPARATLTPEQWLAQDATYRRDHWLKPALAGKPPQVLEHTAHAELVMESWVERTLRRRVLAGLMTHYLSIFQVIADNKDLLSEPESRLLTTCLNLVKTADTAGTHASGIPQDGTQAAAAATNACDIGNAELTGLLKKLFEMFPARTAERATLAQLKETAQNIEFLKASAPL